MMYWDDPGWLGWIAMTAVMFSFWALVIIGIASLLGLDRATQAPVGGDDDRRPTGC